LNGDGWHSFDVVVVLAQKDENALLQPKEVVVDVLLVFAIKETMNQSVSDIVLKNR
jgi:hypothetical protein